MDLMRCSIAINRMRKDGTPCYAQIDMRTRCRIACRKGVIGKEHALLRVFCQLRHMLHGA
jgi:hypothetical protein